MAPVLRSLVDYADTARTWFRMWAADPLDRGKRAYEMYERDKLPTETSGYMNMGYWLDGCDTLDGAGENLADLLAHEGRFTAGDRILDAGCGFGDQDFRWLHARSPSRIVALNVTARHVVQARERAEREGVADRIVFRRGSATEIDEPDGSFDRVVAMESGFHFDTRQNFFEQAFRVLRPGGVLVAADLVPVDDGKVDGNGLIDNPVGRGMGPFPVAFPPDNWHPAGEYEKRLRAAGFDAVAVRSIRDRVYEPWRRYMAARARTPELRSRLGIAAGLMAREFVKPSFVESLGRLDYIVAVAQKAPVDQEHLHGDSGGARGCE